MKDKIRVTITVEGKDHYIWMSQEEYNKIMNTPSLFNRLVFGIK